MQRFQSSLISGVDVARRYEVASALERAVSCVPLDELMLKTDERIAKSLGALNSETDFADLLVQELLKWFKKDFFTWVDQPRCDYCASDAMQAVSHPTLSRPTQSESAHGARRVELYRCCACQNITRFPRYNDPVKLLETRRGRCGEWANCFCLLVRSIGFEVRWVRDWSDHVWAEVFSEKLKGWIHCDPCEEAWNKPLLYSCGWKKKLTYVIAFGRHGIVDVTRKYVPRWQETLRLRTQVPETWLANVICQLTTRILDQLGEERELWKERLALELETLSKIQGSRESEMAGLSGRVSGSQTWKEERGESGSGKGKNVSYTLAHGFSVFASGENPPDEMCYCLFDSTSTSKWLDFGFVEREASFIEVALQIGKRLAGYEMTSANDEPPRDPSSWVVEGQTGSKAQKPLHRVVDAKWNSRHESKMFWIGGDDIESTFMKFRIQFNGVRNICSANSIQLSGLNLFFTEPIAKLGACDRCSHVQKQKPNLILSCLHCMAK